jgi:hypothetical protein
MMIATGKHNTSMFVNAQTRPNPHSGDWAGVLWNEGTSTKQRKHQTEEFMNQFQVDERTCPMRILLDFLEERGRLASSSKFSACRFDIEIGFDTRGMA